MILSSWTHSAKLSSPICFNIDYCCRKSLNRPRTMIVVPLLYVFLLFLHYRNLPLHYILPMLNWGPSRAFLRSFDFYLSAFCRLSLMTNLPFRNLAVPSFDCSSYPVGLSSSLPSVLIDVSKSSAHFITYTSCTSLPSVLVTMSVSTSKFSNVGIIRLSSGF